MNNRLNTKWMMASTVIIVILTLFASLTGIFSTFPYEFETENWQLQAQGQDIGNLIAGIVLLMSAFLAKRGSFRAFLIWIGTLFYLLYAYIIYSVAVHFNSLFLVYVTILGLALYSIIYAVSRHRNKFNIIAEQSMKLVGYTLIFIGAAFGLLWLAEIIPAILSGRTPASIVEAGLVVNPVHVIDLSAILPGFILAGYFTLKNHSIGLFYAAPLLTFSIIMGSSIVAAMILMALSSSPNTLAPLVMVSLIVLLSLVSLVKFFEKTTYGPVED